MAAVMLISVLGMGIVSLFVALLQHRLESRYLQALNLMESAYEVKSLSQHY